MQTIYVPTQRLLAMAAAVLSAPIDDPDGWRLVADADVSALTGYAPRSVHMGWQTLAESGAAEVERGRGGRRRVRPLPHPVWAAAHALVAQS